MKNQSTNIALEGICMGDCADGFITVDRGKPSGVFHFRKRGILWHV